jgi:hypothetical protein
MGEGLSRRRFSLGCIAAAGIVTVAPAALGASKSSERASPRDKRLFGRLKAAFMSTALLHLAGYGDATATFLSLVQAKHHELDAKRLKRVFQVLLTGDVKAIESALRQNGYSVELVSQPLILLGRAGLLPPLHDYVLRRLGANTKSDFTASAAVTLAAGDEWDHALRILARAKETGAGIDIEPVMEDRLWKYAYLHRRVDTVMPVLAEMPFSPEFPELVAYRKWRLKAYQIRAGLPGERVPIIEGEQELGYNQAAAMQVAALADDPTAADYVTNLRRAVKPRSLSIELAHSGFALSVTNVPQLFATAVAQIAARRKDYAGAAELARASLKRAIIYPPSVVIDAFLDERDWRAAAAIAQEHASRESPGWVDEDARRQQFATLYMHIAIAAVRDGDDAAATAFFAKAKPASGADRSADNTDAGDYDALGAEFLLALVASNRLRREYLDVMLPAFISWDDR